MFHRASRPLDRLLSLLDDVLGDAFEEAADHPHAAAHPHRRPLRWERERRGGSVAPAQAHCLSPVRTSSPIREPARALVG